jgi:hypothetical protein
MPESSNLDGPGVSIFLTLEPISKRLKSLTPAKVSAQKRAKNTGFSFSPELQQQTFEIGSLIFKGDLQ